MRKISLQAGPEGDDNNLKIRSYLRFDGLDNCARAAQHLRQSINRLEAFMAVQGSNFESKAASPTTSQAGQAGVQDGDGMRGMSNRRSAAMRGFFPQLAVWLNNRIHFSRMREIEKYLAQATDLADLEHRIAKIERSALSH
jgi:Protein of unknown function (DUF3563)